MKILVVYDSKTGHTEKMALSVARGAETAGAEVTVKRVDTVKMKELQEADGIIMGSPTYFGQMSSKLKHIIDDSIELHTQLTGKVGAAFTNSAGTASGAETTLLSIIQAMLIHGMIVQGNAEMQHYGVAAQGVPKPRELEACEELGARVAQLIGQLKKED
ncbi:MAG TPA: flavodoxin family protein [Candidatus Nanoarchaeia archaeon]|nr:flavodoxin family protein [Candidatus Nanoarchaeia archaeon]